MVTRVFDMAGRCPGRRLVKHPPLRTGARRCDRAVDRAAFERKVPKQDLIAGLVADHLDAGAAGPRRVAVELADDGLTVGRHEFRPAPAPEVLTVAEVAE